MRRHRSLASLVSFTALVSVSGSRALAQSAGFVATLGNDTLHIERFINDHGVYRGTIVTRVPRTRVTKYTMTLNPNGTLARYDVATFEADGSPVQTDGSAGSMTFSGDTIVRVSLKGGKMDTTRVPASRGAVPSPSIPYLGVTFLSYEIAFSQMRARADSSISQLTMLPMQTKPAATRAWLVGADSTELSYFGVAKSGYKFDAAGRLIRADWRATTYRYLIERVDAPDVDALAKRWAGDDARGAAVGALSPHETQKFTLAGADITIDYSRPSRRGRVIWGDVVPWNKVWRLGADAATHFTTTKDLRIGDTDVPAGTYTLWMRPSESGQSKLVINKQTKIFGTMYNPANDFARVPLEREAAPAMERFTLEVSGGSLVIRWGESVYRVAVAVK